jgi:tRNA 2-thiouridine synthesizing protein A
MTQNTAGQKRILDVTADTCPMTFVRTRLALERLTPGEHLEVHVRGTEPMDSVPRMAERQGHRILSKTASLSDSSVLEILIERGAKA